MDGFFIGIIVGLLISTGLSYLGHRIDVEEEEVPQKIDEESKLVYSIYGTFLEQRDALVSLSEITGKEVVYDSFAMKEIKSSRELAIGKIVKVEADRIAKEVSRTGKSCTVDYPRQLRDDIFKGLKEHFSTTEIEVSGHVPGKLSFRLNCLL